MSIYQKLNDLRIANKHTYATISGSVEYSKDKDTGLTTFINEYIDSKFCELTEAEKKSLKSQEVWKLVELVWKNDEDQDVTLLCLPEEFINFKYADRVIGESRAISIRYMDQNTENLGMVNVTDAMKQDSQLLYDTFNRRTDIESFKLEARFASYNRQSGVIHYTNNDTGTHLVMYTNEFSYENLPYSKIMTEVRENPVITVELYEATEEEDGGKKFVVSRKRTYPNPFEELAKLEKGSRLLGRVVDFNRKGTMYVYLPKYKVQIIGGVSTSLYGTPEVGDQVSLEFDQVVKHEESKQYMARGRITDITKKREGKVVQDVANPFLKRFDS